MTVSPVVEGSSDLSLNALRTVKAISRRKRTEPSAAMVMIFLRPSLTGIGAVLGGATLIIGGRFDAGRGGLRRPWRMANGSLASGRRYSQASFRLPLIYDRVERKSGRVVDGSGLENRRTRKGIGGSNPSS